jgi:hypothetical protein
VKDNIVIFPGWYPTEEGVWFGCKLYKDWRLLREAIPEGGCWRRFIKWQFQYCRQKYGGEGSAA